MAYNDRSAVSFHRSSGSRTSSHPDFGMEGQTARESQTKNGTITCPACKSTSITSRPRGYSMANMFTTLWIMIIFNFILLAGSLTIATYFHLNVLNFSEEVTESYLYLCGSILILSVILTLPVSILGGMSGRKEIIRDCMDCGFQWNPGRKPKKKK
jgi:hypothetical protein